NTSTISIGWLAGQLQRPERFCGMHFFNPVHRMPLVEVVRDKETAESTIARVMAYAMQLGKTPILVNDCPGFLVNRILFPYFNAFNRLLLDRVPFERIDAVMEAFGWPMGPAYLADVVGLDILVHADRVLQQGYGERMAHDGDLIAEKLLDAGSRGQKSGAGFYVYGQGERGPRSRQPSAQAQSLIDASAGEPLSLSDEEILERMMIPLCLEAVRCLDEGVVDSPAEVDMGLILGLGFPRFRGGALRYIDSLGLDQFAARAEFHQSCGALYQLTEGFRARQRTGQRFYP
ncbi:MAG: 3-hydroxyacyl-CoA dehydrogenase family protein, partial [Marinobacterium sp.]